MKEKEAWIEVAEAYERFDRNVRTLYGHIGIYTYIMFFSYFEQKLKNKMLAKIRKDVWKGLNRDVDYNPAYLWDPTIDENRLVRAKYCRQKAEKCDGMLQRIMLKIRRCCNG